LAAEKRDERPDIVAELLLCGADMAVCNMNGYRCAAPHSRTENRNSRALAGPRRI
jgi:hypothetical protein